MQLLRDNLTLWTSSDGGEPEAAATADAPKDEKTAEATTAAPAETTAEKTEEAPADS
jgi:14-3-3 protein epsilon